jgi:hypothetical protein
MIVDVKDASFRVFHGRRFWLVDFSLSARTRLRDHFSHRRLPFRLGSPAVPEIIIDGLGALQALLTSPSHIIESRE